MRVRPTLLRGLAVLAGYLVIFFASWALAGVRYDTIGDSAANVRDAMAIALGAGSAYLVIVATALGWWGPAIREARRAGRAWMWCLPIIIVVAIALNLASTRWGRIDHLGAYLFWLVIGSVLVGFAEEFVTRGLLLVGARGSLPEVGVWFVTSLCFGLLHVPNALFGQDAGTTAFQVFFAFGLGTALYVTRRLSGTLIIAMVLHGAWDFSVFVQGHSVDGMRDAPQALGGGLVPPLILLSLVAVWFVLRGDRAVDAPVAGD